MVDILQPLGVEGLYCALFYVIEKKSDKASFDIISCLGQWTPTETESDNLDAPNEDHESKYYFFYL